MALEHTFIGTWEIVSCSFEGKQEISGLEGIKFRLDETGDITWYNDLINPLPESKDCDNCCESTNVLFSCETFDVNENNPRLIFGAFAGHSIEFKTDTLTPAETLILECENWYSLLCKRLKEDQAVGQESEFTFESAYNEAYFSDVVVKSSDGVDYHVHAAILRLNGFDCSMCCPTASGTATTQNMDSSKRSHSTNMVKISITIPQKNDINDEEKFHPKSNLSPIYLVPPPTDSLSAHRMGTLSNSFNCLTSSGSEQNRRQECIRKHPMSSSDSNLQSNANKNIFNFSNDLFLNPVENTCSRKPPLSPYRARSPSPFPSSLDTPPSSPLTPVGILYNLPSFMLTPIFHWLYAESLLPNMDEEICEKLISFAETLPPLIKIVIPCRRYLKLIRLKKFVVDIIMDVHNIFNRIIQTISPAIIFRQPAALFAVFKDSLKDGAVGCAKILQFCNIFIKDAADISRYQKHEIIKYVRTRLPIFMSQVHQLLKNILSVFISLSSEEKAELIVYLVPEIELSLKILTNVIEAIKNSLERMCKDLKCAHLNLSSKVNENAFHQRLSDDISRLPFSRSGVYDSPIEKRIMSTENDLKFVLYMYEVRKMRDIYGRIATALDIIRDKKKTFCDMNILSKRSTILQNLEQLILDIPTYILIIENVSDRLDDKIGWKEFKFCFKLATSQINAVIVKLLDHKPALSEPIHHICKLVQKDEFTKCLIELGLLEESSNVLRNEMKNSPTADGQQADLYDYKNVKLNLTKNLCEAPIVANSSLSKNALRLLHSGQLADMEFEVHVLQNNYGESDGKILDHGYHQWRPSQVHTFRAHRVIVSARCEWFKKALLSGMQESINRKIVISDTSPVIFRRLLLYLYGAPIDKTVGAEQICELMLLADRYSIDDLKALCENTLNALIDEDSVLCLLGIADRFMASVLRSNCLTFISQYPNLTKSDMFKELPKSIQHEVQDLIHWYGRVPEPWGDGFKSRSGSRHSLKSPSKPRSRSRKSSPSFM